MKFQKGSPSRLASVKVYEGSYKAAREQKFMAPFLFFLQLKKLSKTGALYDYLETIEQAYQIPPATVYKRIKELQEAGLVEVRESNKVNRSASKVARRYLWIASINKLYQHLGLPIGDSYDPKEERHVPLYKVTASEKSEIASEIQATEIARNLKRQQEVVKDKYVQRELVEKFGTNPNSESPTVIRRARKQILSDYNPEREASQYLHECKTLSPGPINFDVTLSTRRLANLFGYKSATTGTRHQRKLEQAGKIAVERRKLLVEKGVDYQYFLMLRKTLDLPNTYYFRNNAIWRRLPNKVTVT